MSPNSPHALVTIDATTGTATLVGRPQSHRAPTCVRLEGHALRVAAGHVAAGHGRHCRPRTVTPIGKARPAGTAGGNRHRSPRHGLRDGEGRERHARQRGPRDGRAPGGPRCSRGRRSRRRSTRCRSRPSGLLLAVNSNGGSPANTRLVTINTRDRRGRDDRDAARRHGRARLPASHGSNIAPTLSNHEPGRARRDHRAYGRAARRGRDDDLPALKARSATGGGGRGVLLARDGLHDGRVAHPGRERSVARI